MIIIAVLVINYNLILFDKDFYQTCHNWSKVFAVYTNFLEVIMMDCKTVGQTAFKLGFDVVLPVADLITDIVFTISISKQSSKETQSYNLDSTFYLL